MKRALPTVLGSLLLFAGCSLFTGPDRGDLEFSWQPVQDLEEVEDSEPEVSADGATLTVSGALSAPDPCQELTGQLDRSGSHLALRIRIISEEDGACPTVVASFRYSAVITGLEPRTYELRVIHEYLNTGWSTRTVLEREVTVR